MVQFKNGEIRKQNNKEKIKLKNKLKKLFNEKNVKNEFKFSNNYSTTNGTKPFFHKNQNDHKVNEGFVNKTNKNSVSNIANGNKNKAKKTATDRNEKQQKEKALITKSDLCADKNFKVVKNKKSVKRIKRKDITIKDKIKNMKGNVKKIKKGQKDEKNCISKQANDKTLFLPNSNPTGKHCSKLFYSTDDTDDGSCSFYSEDSGDYEEFTDIELSESDDSNYEAEDHIIYNSTDDDTSNFSSEDSHDCGEFADGDNIFSDSDDSDYVLPDGEVEDRIIHKGTADIRPLNENDSNIFKSDDENSQTLVKEIFSVDRLSTVKQPEGYKKQDLTILNENLTLCQTDYDCPQLVPISDDICFQMYNRNCDSNSDENDSLSSYSIIDDDDDFDIISEDINEKYENIFNDSDDDSDVSMQVDIIQLETKGKLKQVQIKNSVEQGIEDIVMTENYANSLPSDILIGNTSGRIDANIIDINLSISTEYKEIGEKMNEYSDEKAEEGSHIEFAQKSNEQVAQDVNYTSPSLLPTPKIETTFRTIFCNAVDSNHVLSLLKDPFYIYGTVRIIVLFGCIEVYGYTAATGDVLDIFSPQGCSSVKVSAKANEANEKKNLKKCLKKLETEFHCHDLKKISDIFDTKTNALILLKRNVECKLLVNTFKKHMNENVFPNIMAFQDMDRPFFSSEYLLQCILNVNSKKKIITPNEWNELKLDCNSRFIITGGKSVGKSTLLRYLINRHIKNKFKEILVIDLDIGQPELFIPQTISCFVVTEPLLGPGFFHNWNPLRALFIGSTNPVLVAHSYLNAVRKLINHCLSETKFQNIPWVINTMGYNKGFGLELISIISSFIKPTDIVQIESNKDINNFDIHLNSAALQQVPKTIYFDEKLSNDEQNHQYRLHVIKSAITQESRLYKQWDMSAKDLRYANILARISVALQENAEYLNECRPIYTSIHNLKILNFLSEEIPNEQLRKSLSCTLVYLCKIEENSTQDGALECVGIGITRGYDSVQELVYLHPTLPLNSNVTFNCLVISVEPLPKSILLKPGLKVKGIIPFLYNADDGKSTMCVKQMYHRPPQFFSGARRQV